jgi:putative DNA primase/helicase
MGAISDCKAGGIPATLLVPIRPWDKPDAEGKNAGKAPAVVNNNGEWVGIPNWQRGVLPEELDLADRCGGNAGLALGCPESASDDALWNFAALDIDFDSGQEAHRDRLVHAFAGAWDGQSLLIRETVPHRAMLLVRITNTRSVGRKSVYHILYKDPTDKNATEQSIGKLELLATGQQAVIAGTHASGNKINWRSYGREDAFRVPVINGLHDVPLPPAFPSFPDLTDSISNLLNSLSGAGYRYEMRIGGGGETVPDEHLAPPWLTVEKLCALVDRMPNPASTDRDMYVEVMMAIAAARCGIARHRGELSEGMNALVATTAAKWAAKWPNPNLAPGASAFEVELAKWHNDWANYTGNFHTSWNRLVTLAGELGVNDAAAECAQEEFHADPAPPPKPLAPANPDDLPFTSPKSGEAMVYVENAIQSDIGVIDYMRRERSMDQNVCWVAATDTWMSWDNRVGWVATDTARSTITYNIMQELKLYTAKYQGKGTPDAWKAGQVNQMMSLGKAERVTKGLGFCVAVSVNDINNSAEFLQTPTCSYNLRTLETIPTRLRWQLRDTRRTAVLPDPRGSTPLFDALLDVLADSNPEVIEWLWHYFGYALIGSPKAQCFLVLWGAGGNGKGTLVRVLEHIFGDYSTPLDNKVLLQSGRNDHPTELNVIRNKRLATVAEMPKNEKWNESILKKLTGDDLISARNMRENTSSFRSEAALIIHCNELPSFSRITPAILRRFRLVGTMNVPAKVDPRYSDKIIEQESGAILWRMMVYARQVLANGIMLPELPSVMEAQRAEALSDNDRFFGWLQSECVVGPNVQEDFESLEELKDRYEKYLVRVAKENGGGDFMADKVTLKSFKAFLRDRGVRVADSVGNPIRKRRRFPNGSYADETVATGIRLKVKVAVA